jgi:hypothetical protein
MLVDNGRLRIRIIEFYLSHTADKVKISCMVKFKVYAANKREIFIKHLILN